MAAPRKHTRRPARRPAPRRKALPGGAAARALLAGPQALALVDRRGRIRVASEVFARSLGLSAEACTGLRLLEVLPPEGPAPALPALGQSASYRAHLDGVAARVDLVSPRGSKLVAVGLALSLEDADTARSRALLTLSRDLSGASREEDLAGSVARALDLLFPGRSYAIRLLDPGTLALTSMRTRGRLTPALGHRLALRRGAVAKTGLSESHLLACGGAVVERDEPIFAACDRAMAVPLAVGGALHGIIHLEYERGAPGVPQSDEPVLIQIANQAALAARNLRTLEELTHLKTFLEDLIENANALIVVVNRDRQILVFNKALARLTGFPREEALGEDLLDLVPDGERRRVESVLERGLAGESATSFETRLRRKSGGEAHIAANTSAIYGASGEVEGVIAIGQDTTLLRGLQERAEHAQKLAELGKLAAGVVHELNNPLTAVAAYSESLVQKLTLTGGDAGDVAKLRRIREATERLQRLSRDLMAYARPPVEQRELVDLSTVMEEAAAMCEPTLKTAGARVERQLQPVPAVWGQRGSLVQVFVNLITNAAQALPDAGGAIRLESRVEDGQAAGRVSDDGRGMEADVQRRVFEPFFTTRRDGGGTGLGLSIVQGIVSRHGGAISVKSAPGRGTTFTVSLPLVTTP